MSKEIWDRFTEMYNAEMIIKSMPMVEILEAFWCFANGPEKRLKKIFDKYGIQLK